MAAVILPARVLTHAGAGVTVAELFTDEDGESVTIGNRGGGLSPDAAQLLVNLKVNDLTPEASSLDAALLRQLERIGFVFQADGLVCLTKGPTGGNAAAQDLIDKGLFTPTPTGRA